MAVILRTKNRAVYGRIKSNVLSQKERGKSRWDGACLGTNPYRQVNGAVQTKVYVIPALWNIKSGRAVGKSKSAAATNKELDRITLDIHSAYKDLLAKKETVSALEVKNAFQGISSEQSRHKPQNGNL